MAFFQPGNASETTTGGPSQATIALLEALLNAEGQHRRPSFKQFVGGAEMPTTLPAGLGDMLKALGPNAFQTTKTTTGHPGTPSTFSDIASLASLLMLLTGQNDLLGAGSKGVEWVDKLRQMIQNSGSGLDPGTGSFGTPSYGVSLGSQGPDWAGDPNATIDTSIWDPGPATE